MKNEQISNNLPSKLGEVPQSEILLIKDRRKLKK